ncbi:hypothetical protein NL676_013929 [Syzygium grande]|nr:hypothetical protein NL676_013929 [Syzygium grande]
MGLMTIVCQRTIDSCRLPRNARWIPLFAVTDRGPVHGKVLRSCTNETPRVCLIIAGINPPPPPRSLGYLGRSISCLRNPPVSLDHNLPPSIERGRARVSGKIGGEIGNAGKRCSTPSTPPRTPTSASCASTALPSPTSPASPPAPTPTTTSTAPSAPTLSSGSSPSGQWGLPLLKEKEKEKERDLKVGVANGVAFAPEHKVKPRVVENEKVNQGVDGILGSSPTNGVVSVARGCTGREVAFGFAGCRAQ